MKLNQNVFSRNIQGNLAWFEKKTLKRKKNSEIKRVSMTTVSERLFWILVSLSQNFKVKLRMILVLYVFIFIYEEGFSHLRNIKFVNEGKNDQEWHFWKTGVVA